MGAFFSEEHRTFSATGSFNFDSTAADLLIPPQITNPTYRSELITQLMNVPLNVTVSGPTVVGSETEQIQVDFTGANIPLQWPTTGADTVIALSPVTDTLSVSGLLEEATLLPLAVPQLSVGTLYGTAVTLRYLPDIQLSDEIGKLKYFGFGIQHNPSLWLPRPLLFNASVGFFTQKLKLGDLFESTATHIGLQASKSFGPGILSFTPYVGIGWETSSMKFRYTFTSEDGTLVLPVNFELEGDNTTRLTAGASLRIGIINLNADYSLGNTKTATVGLMLII